MESIVPESRSSDGTAVRAHTMRLPHDMATYFRRPDTLADPLFVATVIFNPIRFRSRLRLYQDFKLMVANAGGILYVAEEAFGRREFAVTEAGNPRHLRLRSNFELWHKENAINLLVARIVEQNPEAKYIAVLDADIAFARADWADEIRHALQHYQIVQPWSVGYDLSPDYEPIHKHYSLMSGFVKGQPIVPPLGYYYAPMKKKRVTYQHPGYAMAWRREAWDACGGLIDFSVLGSADAHMAYALVGQMDLTIHPDLHPRYKELLHIWGNRADAAIKRNVGYVPGMLMHFWHGKKSSRGYVSRWRILIEEQFNPDVDLYRDAQGLWQLSDRNPRLRDRIRAYFRSRNEDDISVD